MAKLENRTKENPKLLSSTLSDGRISLYLEYYLGRTEIPVLDEHGEQVYYESGEMQGKPKYSVKHNRKKEILNLYLLDKPRTTIERAQNKETLDLAISIRQEREQQLKEGKLGYRLKAKEVMFQDWMYSYWEKTTKDKRMIKGAMNRFVSFINEEYPFFSNGITPNQISKDMLEHFIDYLKSKSTGDGAYSYWKRFKKMVKVATEKGLFIDNPCNGIVLKADDEALKKDILSIEEMQQLINTTYTEQNQEIRRAFIFTLYTGIRFCDIKELSYENIDYAKRLLSFNQNKTQGQSKRSWVYIPLNDGLLSLVGEASTGNHKEKVFKLPSHTMCLKALRSWTKKAGITKHITWHCGRHSFAVNILNNGANIKTVSSLLGHSSLAMTEKYTRAIDKLKEDAINSLPELKL